MTPEQLNELSELLTEFINTSPYDMGSDEDRTLCDALEIIDNHLYFNET